MYLLLLILATCGMGCVCVCSGVNNGRIGYVFRGIIANDEGWVYFCSRGLGRWYATNYDYLLSQVLCEFNVLIRVLQTPIGSRSVCFL